MLGFAPSLVASGAGGMEMLLLLPAMLFLMWFLVIRPPQKQQRRHQEMLAALDIHDRVYTVGGMVGAIHQIDREKNKVILKVDDSNNTKIEFLLTAIAGPLPKVHDKSPQ